MSQSNFYEVMEQILPGLIITLSVFTGFFMIIQTFCCL